MRTALLVLAVSLASPCASAHADARAVELAQDAVIVDTHIDAPSQLVKKWADIGVSSPDREFDYPRARAGGLDVAFMSIYTSGGQDAAGTAMQAAHAQIDAMDAAIARHPDRFAKLTSPRDVERLRAGGKVLFALGMENGAPIVDDLKNVQVFFDRGVRYITLTHSTNNRISDSSYAIDKQWDGLSPFGEQVVAEMNRLGMMVDVSHLSDAAVRDTLRVAKAPVIASHSGLRRFTPGFERNLSDELLKAIGKSGGVVQLVFGNAFIDAKSAADTQAYFIAEAKLNADNLARKQAGQPQLSVDEFDAEWDAAHPRRPTDISQVLDQVDHARKVVGIDHVGIGSDFDGVSGNLPPQLKTVADYPNLVAGLQKRGYSDGDIRKVLGGNLLRVWQVVEDRAQR